MLAYVCYPTFIESRAATDAHAAAAAAASTAAAAAAAAAAVGVAKAADAAVHEPVDRRRLWLPIGCSYEDGKLVISPASEDVDVIYSKRRDAIGFVITPGRH